MIPPERPDDEAVIAIHALREAGALTISFVAEKVETWWSGRRDHNTIVMS